MDKVLILAAELKNLRERVASIKALPVPLDGLQGPQGFAGKDGKQGLKGDHGPKGDKGDKGEQGKTGEQGVSVVDAEIDIDGSLVLSLSNGIILDAGEVKGERGLQGLQGPPGISAGAADSGVPIYMEANEVFTVKKNKQALFTREIQMEAGAVIVFEQRSVLIEVT